MIIPVMQISYQYKLCINYVSTMYHTNIKYTIDVAENQGLSYIQVSTHCRYHHHGPPWRGGQRWVCCSQEVACGTADFLCIKALKPPISLITHIDIVFITICIVNYDNITASVFWYMQAVVDKCFLRNLDDLFEQCLFNTRTNSWLESSYLMCTSCTIFSRSGTFIHFENTLMGNCMKLRKIL